MTPHAATATVQVPHRATVVRPRSRAAAVLADGVSMAELLRFQALMAAEGLPVHLARMCYDKPYAFDRIANAHASANDPLRRLALGLFQAYHRRDEARTLHA